MKHIPDNIKQAFDALTLELISMGINKYSSDAILHRIRWHHQIERNDPEFRCNNDWTPYLARMFVEEHPEHAKFFEFRHARYRETTTSSSLNPN